MVSYSLDRHKTLINEQYRLLVNSVKDYAIFMLDMNGFVCSWNDGAKYIKGYEEHEILGAHYSRFFLPDDRVRGLPEEALRVALTDGRYEAEGYRLRKGGGVFWASTLIVPIIDDDGRPLGFGKVTRDVTDKRAARRALDEARAALFQSQKMDVFGQLTGGISHDFNNLLTAILGSLETVLMRMPFDPSTTPLIENALRGAERGAALTRRMLTFAARQDLKVEAIDLATLIAEMSDMLRQSVDSSVRIAVDVRSDLPPILADAHQLELALLNLVLNARDAMPNGGRVTIEARAPAAADRPPSPGSFLILSIADTGVGMDEGTVARAAEPFFTTKGIGKGTGLGLSMVKALLEQCGGHFRLSSRLSEGTTVQLWLPLAMGPVHRPLAPAPSAEPEHTGLRILAVDDDQLVLTNTVAMLEDMGHVLLHATSGAGALDILAEQSAVDLVITDQRMPVMTGGQLARTLRPILPGVPIILVSGCAPDPGDLPDGVGFLLKPFSRVELQQAVDMAVAPSAG